MTMGRFFRAIATHSRPPDCHGPDGHRRPVRIRRAPGRMSTRAPLSRAVKAVGVFAASLLVLSHAGAVAAADIDLSKRADGIVAYLGVLPSAMIEGAEESAAHGGPKDGKHRVHVLVALFDATTSARIEDATVTARVAPVGLGGAEKPLEPMTLAGTRTYGNYFSLPGRGPYAITVEVLRPGMSRAIDIRFTYEHALQ